MPTRICPVLDRYIEWIYIIDLDQNVFRVLARDDSYTWDNCRIQYFRLDNIPRWLFELGPISRNPEEEVIHTIYPLMTATTSNVPAEHWADYLRQIPTPDPELLELFQTFSPRPSLRIQPIAHFPAWRQLQLQLLEQFVEYFLCSFHDVCPSRKSSPFIIRQLAFAVLCILRPAGMKFQSTNNHRKICQGAIRKGLQIPSWEPPAADSYWLDNILIVLNEHIYDYQGSPSPTIQAAIAKAVQLATAADISSDITAIIFSIYCIVVVKIHPTPDGPEVSYTPQIPLFSFHHIDDALGMQDMCYVRELQYSTPGTEALMDLFSANRPPRQSASVVLSRPLLPIELCEQMFRSTDPTAQSDLEASCRLFRDMATEYPRIGEWMLLKCTGRRRFIALRSSTSTAHTVVLKPISAPPMGGTVTAFEIGLQGCSGTRLQVNMPLLMVHEVAVVKASR